MYGMIPYRYLRSNQFEYSNGQDETLVGDDAVTPWHATHKG